jgi:putative Mg2+ transporter-C (MgtC) family protein
MEHHLILRLVLAIFFGAIIGFEREYRSKAAGFRTITLITIGSTMFTIASFKLGSPSNPDRIASNIITGIGFIGGGVIFKDGLTVSGITTAATIWIAAAIGMAIGIGEYLLATVVLGLAMVVLALFEKIQDWIDSLHQERVYRLSIRLDYKKVVEEVEAELQKINITFRVKGYQRNEQEVVFLYVLAANQEKMVAFNKYLLQHRDVQSFEEQSG